MRIHWWFNWFLIIYERTFSTMIAKYNPHSTHGQLLKNIHAPECWRNEFFFIQICMNDSTSRLCGNLGDRFESLLIWRNAKTNQNSIFSIEIFLCIHLFIGTLIVVTFLDQWHPIPRSCVESDGSLWYHSKSGHRRWNSCK